MFIVENIEKSQNVNKSHLEYHHVLRTTMNIFVYVIKSDNSKSDSWVRVFFL